MQSRIPPEEAAIRGAALKSAYSFASQPSECPASLVQAIVPESLFVPLRIKIGDGKHWLSEPELANSTSQLPLETTLKLFANSVISVLTFFIKYTTLQIKSISSIACDRLHDSN